MKLELFHTYIIDVSNNIISGLIRDFPYRLSPHDWVDD